MRIKWHWTTKKTHRPWATVGLKKHWLKTGGIFWNDIEIEKLNCCNYFGIYKI